MIPAAFDYVRAGSAEEAIALIGRHGDDAKFLAGGMSLLPLMKLRLATPSVLDMMSDKLDWTKSLGDAMLAQQADLMDAIQRLRELLCPLLRVQYR